MDLTHPSLCALYQQILLDRKQGANELCKFALEGLIGRLRSADLQNVTKQEWLAFIIQLKSARPSMHVMENLFSGLEKNLESVPETGFISDAERKTALLLQRFISANVKVAEHAAKLIAGNSRVMTLSRSSAVLETFVKSWYEGTEFHPVIIAGVPGNEGFATATFLAERNIPVTLITEAQMGIFARQADLVLSGCDTWLRYGYFVNKVGTYPLALVAKDLGVPFWVLADSLKDSTVALESLQLEEMDSKELTAPDHPLIQVKNQYFELISHHLISGRVSENGLHPFI